MFKGSTTRVAAGCGLRTRSRNTAHLREVLAKQHVTKGRAGGRRAPCAAPRMLARCLHALQSRIEIEAQTESSGSPVPLFLLPLNSPPALSIVLELGEAVTPPLTRRRAAHKPNVVQHGATATRCVANVCERQPRARLAAAGLRAGTRSPGREMRSCGRGRQGWAGALAHRQPGAVQEPHALLELAEVHAQVGGRGAAAAPAAAVAAGVHMPSLHARPPHAQGSSSTPGPCHLQPTHPPPSAPPSRLQAHKRGCAALLSGAAHGGHAGRAPADARR